MGANSPEYQKAYLRKHYLANKPYYIAKAKEAKVRVRDYIAELKRRPCTDCKRSYPPYVMDFDHVGVKRFEINRLHNSGSLTRAKAELSQCELVCSNCHRERTHRRDERETKVRLPVECVPPKSLKKLVTPVGFEPTNL